MKRLTAIAATLAAVIAASLSTASPAASTQVPEPADDPFYAVPADVGSYGNGDVIASRKITAIAVVLPVPADTWQIKYRTNDAHGVPTATVTTLMVPRTAWTKEGPRPILSYQPAEDGVGDQCAPSYALRAGLISSRFSNSAAEAAFVLPLLANNWAVAVPDYEGPDSQFLAGRLEGQAVLDGVRAVQRFTPARLSAAAPVGLWGYSGGGFATSIAGQLQPTYAPELNIRGIALGGVVADIRATTDAFSGTPVGGAIAMAINGPMRAFPELDLAQYLSPAGRKKVAAAADDCITDAALRYPFLSIKDLEAFPGALDLPVVANLLRSNSPLGIAGTPSAPVYDYHATFDEMAPIGPDRELMRRYCRDGAVVQHVEHLLAEHISEVITGAPGALKFLQDRMRGVPPKNTCSSIRQP